jgi:GT2 family glycosyltransferase
MNTSDEPFTGGDLADALADLDADDLAPGPRIDPRRLARHHVVAVLVTHNGSAWVERALRAVLDQDRPVDALHVVDTGSSDDTTAIVARILAEDPLAVRLDAHLRTLPRDHGFGTAIAHVLRDHPAGEPSAADHAGDDDVDAPREDWLWLLHDDSAPDPDALRELLTAVDTAPSVALAGPKILGWADPRHLLEVGVTIARGGRRETGLERHEQDQGQHDVERNVLAVSTAGMLARRSVWDALGGLDPALPVFRDDIDLGWRANAAGHRVLVVPRAVVHHAEAATHRRRRIAAGPDQPHRIDRQNAMTVLAAHVPALLLPFLLLGLVVGTLGRVIGFLVGKDPGFALAELRALGTLLTSPGALRRARASRRATRTVPYRDIRPLLARPGTQLRHAVDVVSSVFTARTTEVSRLGSAPQAVEGAAGDLGDDDDVADFLTDADSVLRRTVRRPGVALVLVLTAITLFAERTLLGGGVLLGGTLLPAPGGAADLWDAYTAPWGAAGLGSDLAPAPYVPLVAAASTLLLGKAWLAVDLLVLLAVPLAAASAYVASRQVLRPVGVRVWAAATYAVLPVATGAVATGRIGTLLLLVVLPLAARPLLRVAGVCGPPAGWRTAWGVALLLAALAAFVPSLWILAVVLAAVAAFTTARDRAARLRLAAAVGTPVLLLLPWTLRVLGDPGLLLTEAGVMTPDAATADPNPLGVLALAPGGPGTPASWVGLGVVLAAVVAVVRGRRPRVVRIAWVVAAASLGLGTLVAGATVRVGDDGPVVPAWPGPFVVVATAALLVAAMIAARGARAELTSSSFGWRQPVAVVVTALCVLGPVVAVTTWISDGADDPLRRGDSGSLPAFVAVDLGAPERPRAVLLRPVGDEGVSGGVGYTAVRDDGTFLGDAETAADPPERLSDAVADLASGRGGSAAGVLARYGVRYVVVDAPVDRLTGRNLDSAPGLRRVSSNDAGAVWRVGAPAGRVRLVAPDDTQRLLPSTGALRVDTELDDASPGGRLELAEVADDGWRATFAGQTLDGTEDESGLQTFQVPAGAGRLVITLDRPSRAWWVLAQGVLFVVVVVLALPSRGRDGDGEDA